MSANDEAASVYVAVNAVGAVAQAEPVPCSNKTVLAAVVLEISKSISHTNTTVEPLTATNAVVVAVVMLANVWSFGTPEPAHGSIPNIETANTVAVPALSAIREMFVTEADSAEAGDVRAVEI